MLTAQQGRTTKQVAADFGVKPPTVIRSYCVKGHYCGLVPQKLPNRLLVWPPVEQEGTK